MNNKWTSMNKIAVRVSYGVYILALLFVVVMLFFDRYQFEPYAIGALVSSGRNPSARRKSGRHGDFFNQGSRGDDAS